LQRLGSPQQRKNPHLHKSQLEQMFSMPSAQE